jgi:hypothetical protein
MAKLKYKVLSDSISYKFKGRRYRAFKEDEIEIPNTSVIEYFVEGGYVEEIKKEKKEVKEGKKK